MLEWGFGVFRILKMLELASNRKHIVEDLADAFHADWLKALGINGLGRVLLNFVSVCVPLGV